MPVAIILWKPLNKSTLHSSLLLYLIGHRAYSLYWSLGLSDINSKWYCVSQSRDQAFANYYSVRLLWNSACTKGWTLVLYGKRIKENGHVIMRTQHRIMFTSEGAEFGNPPLITDHKWTKSMHTTAELHRLGACWGLLSVYAIDNRQGRQADVRHVLWKSLICTRVDQCNERHHVLHLPVHSAPKPHWVQLSIQWTFGRFHAL